VASDWGTATPAVGPPPKARRARCRSDARLHILRHRVGGIGRAALGERMSARGAPTLSDALASPTTCAGRGRSDLEEAGRGSRAGRPARKPKQVALSGGTGFAPGLLGGYAREPDMLLGVSRCEVDSDGAGIRCRSEGAKCEKTFTS
jgi:hypothetical protein